jgi:alcohol dehydrogenase
VHGCKVDLELERLWSHNVTITTGLVDTFSIPMLLKTVQSNRIDAAKLITHRFKLTEVLAAYDTFSRAGDTKALKVLIEA